MMLCGGSVVLASAALRAGSCLYAFNRRKPLAASIMPAAVQRNAIAAFRHRFTLRQTQRTVGAGERAPELYRQAEAVDGQHLVEPFEDAGGDTGRLLVK